MSEQTINLTQLLDTFQLFDTNKDGCISSNEVCLIKRIQSKTNFRFFFFLYSFDQLVKNYKCQSMKKKFKIYFKIVIV